MRGPMMVEDVIKTIPHCYLGRLICRLTNFRRICFTLTANSLPTHISREIKMGFNIIYDVWICVV